MSFGNKKTVDFSTISCIIDRYEKTNFLCIGNGADAIQVHREVKK